jgi:hypothetical protein
MHFAQAMRSYDGVNINVFGAGSDINGIYAPTTTLCQFNTQTNSWKEIKPNNAPPARRNAAFEVTQSGLTFIWGNITNCCFSHKSFIINNPFLICCIPSTIITTKTTHL